MGESVVQEQLSRGATAMEVKELMDIIAKGPQQMSRWKRPGYKPEMGPEVNYTVQTIANVGHISPLYPPQVIYIGDNMHVWTMPLADWPGNLIPE